MSVSECILNIQMLAQDDLKSFLKIASKTIFLKKNDTFIIVIDLWDGNTLIKIVFFKYLNVLLSDSHSSQNMALKLKENTYCRSNWTPKKRG